MYSGVLLIVVVDRHKSSCVVLTRSCNAPNQREGITPRSPGFSLQIRPQSRELNLWKPGGIAQAGCLLFVARRKPKSTCDHTAAGIPDKAASGIIPVWSTHRLFHNMQTHKAVHARSRCPAACDGNDTTTIDIWRQVTTPPAARNTLQHRRNMLNTHT